jgi:hypothetical protein
LKCGSNKMNNLYINLLFFSLKNKKNVKNSYFCEESGFFNIGIVFFGYKLPLEGTFDPKDRLFP